MENKEVIKVFVSYKRLDQEFVRKLTEDLKAHDIDPWVDWLDIPTGEDWRQLIGEGMKSSHAVLFIMSPAAVASKEIRFELEMAMASNKRILPVLYQEEVDIWDKIPEAIARKNAVNMRTDAEYVENFPGLLEALRVDFEHVRQHTKIQQRAMEWDSGSRRSSYLLHGEALQSVESWMVESTGKEPALTSLQMEFVRASREDETNRHRRTLIGVSIGLAVALVLAVVALTQWFAADAARTEAVFERDRAVAAENVAKAEQQRAEELLQRALDAEDNANFQRDKAIEAENQAKASRDEALSARQAAEDERDNARQQEQIALARRLGAEGLLALSSSEIERSMLLSLVSLKLDNNSQADLVLRSGLDLLPTKVALLPGSDTNPAVYNLDGSRIFAGSADGRIAIWNTRNPKPDYLAQGSLVTALAYHPSRNWLAAAGVDGSLVIWDTDSGEQVRTYTNPSPVVRMAFSPNGRSLVSVGRDNVVRIWSTSTNDFQFSYEHRDTVTGLDFSQNGSFLATSSLDGRVYFYNITTRNLMMTLSSTNPFTAMDFHPNKLIILTGDALGLVQAWDMTTGREFLRMSHEKAITDVLISLDGSRYLTASEDMTVRAWSTTTAQMLSTLVHAGPVRDIALDQSGDYLASASDEGTVRIWNLVTGQEEARSPFASRQVTFAPGGSNVLAMGRQPSLYIFNYTSATQAAAWTSLNPFPSSLSVSGPVTDSLTLVAAGSTLQLWQPGQAVPLSSFSAGADVLDTALTPAGDLAAVSDSRGQVCLWQTASRKRVGCATFERPARSVQFARDGAWLVVGAEAAYVLDSADLKILYTVPLPAGSPEDAAVFEAVLDEAGERLVMSSTADARVYFVDLATGATIFETPDAPTGHPGSAVAFVPGREWIISTRDQNILVWDSRGELVQSFFNSTNVETMDVSPDGRRLAIAGADQRAYVWDLENGRETARIPHTSTVMDLAFTADSSHLVTTSADGRVQINSLLVDDLNTEACRRLTRNLSFSEWMLYVGGGSAYEITCPALPPGEGVIAVSGGN